MVPLPCGDVSRGMFEEAVGNDKVGTFTEVQKSLSIFTLFSFRPGKENEARGRPRTCLLSTLRADLKKVGMNLRTPSGLEQLCIHAADRDKWEETIEHIYSA